MDMTWLNQARCLNEDPELFFPVGNTGPALEQIEQAKSICRQCNVAANCLEYAIKENQETASKLGKPCSASVGISGAAGERFRVVTPKATISCCWIKGKAEDKLSNSMDMRPPNKSGKDCARPL
jgi:WhiB family redox-sensing transcriptional regulator